MKYLIPIMIVLAVVVAMVNSAFSFESRIYWVSLNYDKGNISLKDEVLAENGYAPDRKSQPDVGYRSEIVSFSGDILYSFKFGNPNVQCSDFMDSETKQMSGNCVSLDRTDFVLLIPYFKEGKTINIYDSKNVRIFSTNIGHLAMVCGDSICQTHESYKTCPQDCSSGSFDMYCDGIKDDLCDPDCMPETDSDCIGKLIMADVDICADKNCSQRNKTFIAGEMVYFKINFNNVNFDISSTIKTPGGEIKYLTFKDNLATFQSDEVGTFSLWVNFSKEEQLKSRAEKYFFYTEKPDKTSPVSICNADGKCEGEENAQNCPQDCLSKTTGINNKFYIFIIIVLLSIASGIIMFVSKRKKKKEEGFS